MKSFSSPNKWACVCAVALSSIATLNAGAVYETELEFLTTGDFNGDGQRDIALVDRYTGRLRLGYRLSSEFFNWANWRAGGPKDQYTSVSVGKITDAKYDSLALAAADANLITVVNATDPNVESDPLKIAGTAIGPSLIVAVDVGGPGNTPLLDLYVSSIYNADPTPNRATLFRNTANRFTQAADLAVTGTESHGNRLALKSGGPEYVVVISSGETGNVLRADRLDSGKPEEVLTIAGLPAGVDYVAGNFSATGLKDFVFYKAGETELRVSTLAETGGKFKASALKTITLTRPVRQLAVVDGEKKSQLLAIFGDAEPAEVMNFDGANPPATVHKLAGATNSFLRAGVALPDAVVLLSVWTNDVIRPRPVSHYQVHLLKDGSYVPAAYGKLALLDDRDDSTVPLIYTNIIARSVEKTAADMKPYTNMVPGTDVPYQMVALPGGEFTMGSPDSEKDRKPDEGPQHKVKLSPFWMGQFEVTWDQYLLFMYPDDEKKLRDTHKTDATINEVSDAVTRPSKPYVDMSFGMGKSGFPAIAMTHHAANKFCHWLSAKTGHFYRLPTEAEWEYACRAGRTTAYYFGDDPAMLEPGVFAGVVRESSGTVEYQRAGGGDWLPAKVEQTLQTGDKLRTATGSRAVVQFAYSANPSPVSENATITIPKPDCLGQYAWYFDNSNSKYQKVGKKLPNPWGIYDMHGNVVEWVLDQHVADYYAKSAAQGVVADPWNRATQPYPHSLRGGSWDDDPQQLRSAARRGSDRSLKATDPQLPKGIWYLTDGQVVGFRVVRPLAVPSAEDMAKYWISGVEKD